MNLGSDRALQSTQTHPAHVFRYQLMFTTGARCGSRTNKEPAEDRMSAHELPPLFQLVGARLRYYVPWYCGRSVFLPWSCSFFRSKRTLRISLWAQARPRVLDWGSNMLQLQPSLSTTSRNNKVCEAGPLPALHTGIPPPIRDSITSPPCIVLVFEPRSCQGSRPPRLCGLGKRTRLPW